MTLGTCMVRRENVLRMTHIITNNSQTFLNIEIYIDLHFQRKELNQAFFSFLSFQMWDSLRTSWNTITLCVCVCVCVCTTDDREYTPCTEDRTDVRGRLDINFFLCLKSPPSSEERGVKCGFRGMSSDDGLCLDVFYFYTP